MELVINIPKETIKKLNELFKEIENESEEKLTIEESIASILEWKNIKDTNYLYSLKGVVDRIKEVDTLQKRLDKNINECKKFINEYPEYRAIFNLMKEKRQELFKGARNHFSTLKSCSICREFGCCTNFSSHFTTVDYLYIAESNLSIKIDKTFIIKRLLKDGKFPCVFLRKDGCCLPYDLRPNTCLFSICERLRKELKKKKTFSKVNKILDEVSRLNSVLNSVAHYKLYKKIKNY